MELSPRARRVLSIVAVVIAFVFDFVATYVNSQRYWAFSYALVILVAAYVSHAQEARRDRPDLGFTNTMRLIATVPVAWAAVLLVT
jgi:hypothetical protein